MQHQDTKTLGTSLPEATNRIASQIVDASFAVHRALGPGLLESVYEAWLVHELHQRGQKIDRQLTLPVQYRGFRLESGLQLDLVVERSVVVELKTVESVLPIHKVQLLTDLKLSGYRLGLLVNFNSVLIKDGIYRMIL